MEKIKISVIIPVYNVEKYIEECIESVINQTLKEIEIIIVNDGTKDNSMKRIEKYLSDPRIIVINKENGGLSSARNAGLKIAKGEYISFVDSDDYISERMMEELYNGSEEAEIVFSNIIFYKDKTKEKVYEKRIIPFKNTLEKGSHFYPYSSVVACCKLYKRKFLIGNKLCFKEGIIHEDELFSYQTSFLAKKVKYVDKNHYYYRTDRDGSIMNNSEKDKHIFGYENVFQEIKKYNQLYAGSDFEKLRTYLYEKYYLGFVWKLKQEKVERNEIKEFEKVLKEYFENNNFSKLEHEILKEDIKKVIKYKQYYPINLLDSFYWKNRLLSPKIIRRVIEGKIKNILMICK